MPKESIIRCAACGQEYTGTLPDDKAIGHEYVYCDGRYDIDTSLAEALQRHHVSTASYRNGEMSFGGHNLFNTYALETPKQKASQGFVRVSSYCVAFRELPPEEWNRD